MFPVSFRRALRATPFLAAMTAIVGCNTLLDNRPGEPREDVSPTSPDPEGVPGDGAQRDGGASGSSGPQPATDRDDDAGTNDSGECAASMKQCGGICVSKTDPHFGCAGVLCELCAPPHATAACVAGACAVGTCAAGFADCNGLPADGCEADVSRVTSCGACGVVCPARPHYQPTCVGGVCAGVCAPGFADCNADPSDGCETNLLNERLDCGQCGRVCIVGKCKAGKCTW
jgi:hypothetical protein